MERMLAALQGCGKDQMSGCGWSPSWGSLESQLRVWGKQRTPGVGGGTGQQQPQHQQLQGGGLQLHSLLPPSGDIWVLQGMDLKGNAERSELEDTCRECCLVFSGCVLQRGEEITHKSPGKKLGLRLAFTQGRVLPLSPVVLRKLPWGLRARQVELCSLPWKALPPGSPPGFPPAGSGHSDALQLYTCPLLVPPAPPALNFSPAPSKSGSEPLETLGIMKDQLHYAEVT